MITNDESVRYYSDGIIFVKSYKMTLERAVSTHFCTGTKTHKVCEKIGQLAANASGRRGMVSRACWDLGVSDVIASYTYFSGVEIMTGKCQLFKTVMYFLTYNYYIMFFWLLLVRESLIWQLVSFLRLEGRWQRFRAAAIGYKIYWMGRESIIPLGPKFLR